MVIVPIEPIVLQIGNGFEAFALRRPGGSTALEIPAAALGGIHQDIARAIGGGGAEKFSRGSLRRNAAHEGADRLAVGAGEEQQRHAADAVLNWRLLKNFL